MFKKLIFVVVLSLIMCHTYGQDIYVSVDGNDSNNGAKESPVATFKVPSMSTKPITVWVGRGQYNLDESLVFNDNDSGEPGFPIVWRARSGDQVSITGGKEIPSEKFKKVSNKKVLKRLTKNAAKNIRQVDLKALGITNYGQFRQYGHAIPVSPAPLELFYNNSPMPLARYPNKGFIQIGEVSDRGSVPRNRDYSGRGATFKYTDARHEKWAGLTDVWFQGTFDNGYADDNLLVESIDINKKEVKLKMPSMYGVSSGAVYRHYVALNILDEIDTPGEWYLDRDSGILYFWPPNELKNSSVTISMLEDPIVSFEGASYITFRDFTVEAGRGIGIYMERGSNNLIAGCTVRNVGTSGIFMGQGAKQTVPYITHDDYQGVPVSRRVGSTSAHIYKYSTWNRNAGSNHGILSCNVYNTGSGGIYLSGGSKQELIPGNNYAENCKVHDYNRRNKFLFSGINIDGCGNRISHCEIYNSDFQAIYVRGNEHLFEYNNIHDVTLDSDDTSPWYIGRDPSDRGNVIRYNYFHHIGNKDRANMGIYCDDATTDVLVFGNVFYEMNTKHGILFSNTGWDLRLKNNIIINSLLPIVEISAHYYTWGKSIAQRTFSENGLIWERLTKNVNIKEAPYNERYPELCNYLDPIIEGKEWEGMRTRRNVMANNLIVTKQDKQMLLLRGDYAQCDTLNNYRTGNDPGFVDFENKNFNLKSDSEVYEKIPDFKPIPFNDMGLYIDEFRKDLKN